jgi:hypothetical protein
MDLWFRRIEITLLVMLGLVYVAAKIHFFTRYQAHDSMTYVAGHWPFWAAIAIIGAAMGILDCVRWVLQSKAKSGRLG